MMQLAITNPIILDRPKGIAHPRYADLIYPLDYGYLRNTSAGDGDGIDVWIGSLNNKTLTGILCTFDRLTERCISMQTLGFDSDLQNSSKNLLTFERSGELDAEIKLLIAGSLEYVETIQNFNPQMQTLFIPNPLVKDDLSH